MSCDLSWRRTCSTALLEPGGTATLRERVRVTASTGVVEYVASASIRDSRATDPDLSNNSATATTIVAAANHDVPTLSPVHLLTLVAAIGLAGALVVGRS